MPSLSLTKTEIPAFVQAILDEIDHKTYGAAFDVMAEDISFRFGAAELHGRAAVRENFRKMGQAMDTHHVTFEFWDGGAVKLFRGEVVSTPHATGEMVKPSFVHIVYMDEADPTKIRSWFGAVGPEGQGGPPRRLPVAEEYPPAAGCTRRRNTY